MAPSAHSQNGKHASHPKHKRTSTKTKTNKCSQEASHCLPRSPTSPPPGKDFMLFPDHPKRTPGSNGADAKPCTVLIAPDPRRTTKRPLSSFSDHVSGHQGPKPTVRKPRVDLGDYKCLNHLSSYNCTAECFNAEWLANARKPPPAPSPPRLPTPDLSDLDEDEMWSCCSFNSVDSIDESIDGDNDDNDDELDNKLARAIAWQNRTRKAEAGSRK